MYSPEHPTVKGLFFVGASTRPGNGVPLVLTGAQLVADRIIRQHPELFTQQ
jgi:phytoene dehydrogenase-like protein